MEAARIEAAPAVKDLGRRTGSDAGLGGIAAELVTYDEETTSRFPFMVVALSLVTWLVLVVIFRALLLPLIAVLLNLVTVAAAFGLVTALFQTPDGLLGGAGFLDAVSVAGIFTIMFGLSIDYEVFLLARMREGYRRSGSNEHAITFGIERTAGVVTGAALIMTGVFLAFATAELANMRQFGIGMAVAVVLDATVVRLLLLPAVMRLFGRWNWWLPRRLGRVLPKVGVESSEEPRAARRRPTRVGPLREA